jgi:flagellar biosynthesis/type III secretory pathway M-ring protein FliF/YscJ
MENRKGLLSHFGGIIRMIILIICVAIIAFFVIRFVRSRGASQTPQLTQVSQNESGTNTQNKEPGSGGGASSIPGGVSEGDEADETSRIPEVGMGFDAAFIAVVLSLGAYLIVRMDQNRTAV